MDICNNISNKLNELIIYVACVFEELINENEMKDNKIEVESLIKMDKLEEGRFQFYRYEDENIQEYGNEDWIDEWDKV